uniref:Uncharacterized protein n=1 Tax=Aplanochytrium stocchinoi TaxID=215587 RepID=A0A7S3PRI2_9STRA
MSSPNVVASNVIADFVKNIDGESPRPGQPHGKYDAHVSHCMQLAHGAFCKSLQNFGEEEVVKKWFELQTHLYSLAFRKSVQAVFEDLNFAAECSSASDVLGVHAKAWRKANPNNPLLVNIVDLLMKIKEKELQFKNHESLLKQIQQSYASLRVEVFTSKSAKETNITGTRKQVTTLFQKLSKNIDESCCSTDSKQNLHSILKQLHGNANTLTELNNTYDDGTLTDGTKAVDLKKKTKKRDRDSAPLHDRSRELDKETETKMSLDSRSLKRLRHSSNRASSDEATMDVDAKITVNNENRNTATLKPRVFTAAMKTPNAESPLSKLDAIRAREMEKVRSRSDVRVKKLKNKGKHNKKK